MRDFLRTDATCSRVTIQVKPGYGNCPWMKDPWTICESSRASCRAARSRRLASPALSSLALLNRSGKNFEANILLSTNWAPIKPRLGMNSKPERARLKGNGTPQSSNWSASSQSKETTVPLSRASIAQKNIWAFPACLNVIKAKSHDPVTWQGTRNYFSASRNRQRHKGESFERPETNLPPPWPP